MIKRLNNDKVITWIFLIPTFITLGITALIPLLYSIWLSLFNVRINIPDFKAVFVGLNNYLKVSGDLLFVRSTVNTVIFAVVTVLIETVAGLIIAMMLSGDSKLARWARALFLVPMIMAPVASGTLWRMMLDRSTGIINYILSLAGIQAVNWLGQPRLALLSIILVDVWRLTPWVTIIIVSALKGISITSIEAALVDGASRWKIFSRVIFPLLKPVMIIVLLIRLIDAFKVFDIVYVMTSGGPGMATEMLPNYIYNQGLKYFDAGYAAALALLFIAAMSLLSLFFIRTRIKQGQKVK